mmetsp:Transcript_23202/g.50235  ORF Transcript_23202/g.50235 Transcript_23202/m.50235 type:complete len:104 (+) Transcript_23202:96-407(+)
MHSSYIFPQAHSQYYKPYDDSFSPSTPFPLVTAAANPFKSNLNGCSPKFVNMGQSVSTPTVGYNPLSTTSFPNPPPPPPPPPPSQPDPSPPATTPSFPPKTTT